MKTKLILIAAAMLLAVSGSKAQSNTTNSLDKFDEVVRIVKETYPDTINQDRLIDNTIKMMLKQLDPHTSYKTPAEAEEEQRLQSPEKIGIGAECRYFSDTLTVTSVKPKSPARKAGIRVGMQIDSINGQPVTHRVLTGKEIVSIIESRSDSLIISVIRRKGTKKYIIPKSKLPRTTIDAQYSPNDSTTYIKIGAFNKYTGDEFDKALASVSHKKLRNVIIDLRDNPGGTLQPCVQICNHIIPENGTIFTTYAANDESKAEFADHTGLLKNSRIYVIINENSASASEVVASSVQDNDRGVVIGRRSYGKALTQQIIWLPDGSKLSISNGRIVSPSGRCIQKPYVRGNFDSYYNETITRKCHKEHLFRDSISTAGKPMFKTVMKHRTVYGEMGVIPDIFVPEDSTNVPKHVLDSIYAFNVENYAYDYVNTHRDRLLTTYGGFNKFYKTFKVSDLMVDAFHRYVQDENYNLNNVKEELNQETNKDYRLKIEIKACIALVLYGNNEYRQILNDYDNDYQAALKLIADPQSYWKHFE